MATRYANQKAKLCCTGYIFRKTQYFNELVFKVDGLSVKLKFYRGLNSSQNTLTALEIGFEPRNIEAGQICYKLSRSPSLL